MQKQVSLHTTAKYIMQTVINKLEQLNAWFFFIKQQTTNQRKNLTPFFLFG